MLPCSYRYDPKTQEYLGTGEPVVPRAQRKWERLPGAPAAAPWGASADRVHDGDLALEYFELTGPPPPRAGVMADIACGDAWMARHFVRSGKFDLVFALDLCWDDLERAREAAEQERLAPAGGFLLLRADAGALPFRDGHLDYAWFGQGLHMLGDPARALRSIFAALRPGGGRLVVSTMASFFSSRELRCMTEGAGFGSVRLRKSAGRTVYTLSAAKP